MIEYFETRRIWNRAIHNAFTDLIRFNGRWFCAFREASAHLALDGQLRILTSLDGVTWVAAASIACPLPFQDLRDPKLSLTPEHKLLLNAAAFRPVCQSMAWVSEDGYEWGTHHEVGPRGSWLWRTVWHRGIGYSFGRDEPDKSSVQLYASADGIEFRPRGQAQLDGLHPNESDLLFLSDATCVCLMRCDGFNGRLGFATPPYERWTWKDLGARIGGPAMLRLADDRTIAAVRLYDQRQRTALCWLDFESATLAEFLTMPSGGDTSYAGMVWHDDLLWLSYYSSENFLCSMKEAIRSEEPRTSIFLARLRLLPARR